jgi:hypothetical protein
VVRDRAGRRTATIDEDRTGHFVIRNPTQRRVGTVYQGPSKELVVRDTAGRRTGKGLTVRVGAAAEPEALKRPFVARCLGAGRPMVGFLLVELSGVAKDADLRTWLDLALAYVGDLPPKKAKPRKMRSLDPKARH